MAPLHRRSKVSTLSRRSTFTPRRAWQPLAGSIAALVLVTAAPLHAVSGINAPLSIPLPDWNLNPGSGDWNTAANWMSATVPNSSGAVAVFATSTVTSLGISHGTRVHEITYNPGASAFTVSNTQFSFDFDGVGIANNSGLVQNFVAGAFTGGSAFGSNGAFGFNTNASAGVLTKFTANGGVAGNLLSSGGITFLNTSTAGSAVFAINGGNLAGASGANVAFFNTSTAGNSTVTVNGGPAASTGGGTVRFFRETLI